MRNHLIWAVGACLFVSQSPARAAVAVPPTDQVPKKVRLLATGGTIAGSAPASSTDYRPGVVPIADILRTVPGLNDIAQVSAEQVANVGSYDMDEALWLKIFSEIEAAAADPQVSGIVITHGTDTLEETAYFLSLVSPSSKPVVMVGSMRPGNAVSADGPQNLLDAVCVASAHQARGRGVMIVMNDTIFDPDWVTKVDVRRVNAFAAPSRGPIGQVLTDRPVFFGDAAKRRPAFAITTDKLPRVTVAYAYVGVSGDDIRELAKGAKGLVIAGVGAGGFSASARAAVKQLTSEGFPVVRTARQGVGDIWWTSVGGVNDAELGTIAGRELTPAKARILLMLALQSKRSREELQRIFDKLGTGEH